jgi:hypothetical protein
MTELFTPAVLTALSGRDVTGEQAAAIHTWVLALIETETGPLPTPVPAGVVAVGLELARAALPAPGGVSSTTIGPYSVSYPTNTRATDDALSHSQRLRLHKAMGKPMTFSVTTRATIVDGEAR